MSQGDGISVLLDIHPLNEKKCLIKKRLALYTRSVRIALHRPEGGCKTHRLEGGGKIVC
jgi:hypothetical protein